MKTMIFVLYFGAVFAATKDLKGTDLWISIGVAFLIAWVGQREERKAEEREERIMKLLTEIRDNQGGSQ